MVILTTISSESPTAQQAIAKWATAEDMAGANLGRNPSKRHNSLLAKALLRALLANVTATDAWEIRADPQGKPYLVTSTGQAAPHISISHSHKLVACAISYDGPLGIDVEYHRPRNFTALAAYAFGPQEQAEIARDGLSAFYRIWTLREAMSKMTGVGIMVTLDGRDCAANTPTSGCFTLNAWQCFCCVPHINYSLAVATKGHNAWSVAMKDATLII